MKQQINEDIVELRNEVVQKEGFLLRTKTGFDQNASDDSYFGRFYEFDLTPKQPKLLSVYIATVYAGASFVFSSFLCAIMYLKSVRSEEKQ